MHFWFRLRQRKEKNLWTGLQVNLCQNLLFLHQLTHNYDDRLFIELQVQYMKIPSSNLGRTCCVQKLFLTFRTIFVYNMFSLCSAKRRASNKDLPVMKSTHFFRNMLVSVNWVVENLSLSTKLDTRFAHKNKYASK